MGINKLALLAGLVLSAILFAEVTTHADEVNQSTKLTFSEPIAIPGQTLPAGTYLIKRMDLGEPDVVQIFNADGSRLYATLQTISTERPNPIDNTVVTLAQQGPEKPEALVNWFYPGNTIGHEFVYSKQEAQEIAQYRQQTIAAQETSEAGD